MKRSIIPFLALALLYVTATAQGEWKWAHYWSGGDGSYSDYYNYITNTAFDNEGNIYVYGSMGGSAVFDGNTFQFSADAELLGNVARSILLAKFDTLGSMLWYKVLKSESDNAVPLWMEVRNDKVFVVGDCGFNGVYANSCFYYWDTLITRAQINALPQELQKPPKSYGRWTFLAQFDLNGNLLDDHFVQAYSRELHFNGNDSTRFCYTLCERTGTKPTPAHIDNCGNYYIYTPIFYRGSQQSPYTIVVDEDSTKIYDLFLPGDADMTNINSRIYNAMLFKFSPSGELLFAKTIVDHTDGIAPYYSIGDTVNRYFYTKFHGMSFDEDENMYLTGYVQLAQHLNGQGGESHDYPVHIWWDSTHCLTMNDISSAQYCNFIIKYDTSGNVIWCNQAYTQVQQAADIAYVRFYRNFVGENAVFICGDAENYHDTGSAIFFEHDVNNGIDRCAENQRSRAFYVAFDKNTGAYIKNAIVPHEEHSIFANETATPAVQYNQLVTSAITGRTTHSMGIARWNLNGSFIAYTPISMFPTSYSMGCGPTIMNNQGYALFTVPMKGNIAFSEDVVINGDAEHSNAVFALYHDPRFAEPFVPDDTVDIAEYQHNRESDIYLYPNPTSGEAIVCGYMYDYRSIELFDLQGRKLADLAESHNGTSLPIIDLTPYPAGTYLVRINFNRGVSVTRKVVKGE